eukprot:scaffold126095_cov18-Tisochrysis_lutea.AAC.1
MLAGIALIPPCGRMPVNFDHRCFSSISRPPVNSGSDAVRAKFILGPPTALSFHYIPYRRLS